MNSDVLIEFEGGYLKSLTLGDVHQEYIKGLNDPGVNRYLDGVKHNFQTEKTVSDFILYNQEVSNAILFGIWLVGDRKHCGTIRLHGIEHYHKTAHIGICLFDKSVWGKGLGKKAIRAVTQWAFNHLNLRWIEAGAYAENIASKKTFLAADYEWIYDVPDKYLLDNKPTRISVFAVLKDRYGNQQDSF